MRTRWWQKVLSILCNLAVVRMELEAIPLSWGGIQELMFIFYTELTNIFAMGVCALTALCQIWALVSGRELPVLVKGLKYTAACCLALVFLTVVFVLAPMWGPGGHYIMLFTTSMLYNHLLNPLTAFFSFVLFERAPALPRRAAVLALAPTVLYGGAAFALNAARVIDGPYPFLKVYEQSVAASCLWAVGILAANYLIARIIWRLNGNARRAAER